MFFGEVLVGLSVSVLPKKYYDQEFTLCFFLSINFHCLILEHGYLQSHIKNSGTVMMLQFKIIVMFVWRFALICMVRDAMFAGLSLSLKNSIVFLQI